MTATRLQRRDSIVAPPATRLHCHASPLPLPCRHKLSSRASILHLHSRALLHSRHLHSTPPLLCLPSPLERTLRRALASCAPTAPSPLEWTLRRALASSLPTAPSPLERTLRRALASSLPTQARLSLADRPLPPQVPSPLPIVSPQRKLASPLPPCLSLVNASSHLGDIASRRKLSYRADREASHLVRSTTTSTLRSTTTSTLLDSRHQTEFALIAV
jgi:hypothetical protein